MVILFVGLVVISFWVMDIQQNNLEVCETYWGEECFNFNTLKNMCYCESGNKLTTPEMIANHNELITKINKESSEEYWREKTKDWNEIRVSQRFSQEEWYKLLGKKLDNTVSSGAITRSDLELPEFQLQFFFAHKRINEGIHLLNSCQTKTEEKKLLATYFPMSYHQFDSHLINFDPEEALESGEYIFREPHHPLEKEYMESSIQ
jgi:hypothetical protein